MAVVQISRIQHRRGLATDLPQLAAGELGWVVDEQRLYIGNGTVADGAPAVGNTEIMTAGSSSFLTAISYIYKGYLGASTPIVTGNGIDITRTLQQRLDDYVSIKAFGATGDGSTDDTAAIQRALDELYTDTDKTDSRSRRKLFFPAGQYNISSSITIPPYATIEGEGIDKSIIYYSGSSAPVAKTQDNAGNEYGAMTTVATNINIEGMTFKNGTAHNGVSLDSVTNARFVRCKFQGTYAAGGADVTTSKGVTIRSTNALTCSNIIFDSCEFTKFARLADFSYDATSIKLHDCKFSTGRYGVYVGEAVDGSTNGLTIGPKDVKITSSTFDNIYSNGIRVDGTASGANSGVGEVRGVVSFNNFFARTVGTANDDVNLTDGYSPIILFNTDECSSLLDYFDGTQRRSTSITPIPEVQGIGISQKQIQQITLADNTSSATTTGIRLHVSANKKIVINYKIERGTGYRVGTFVVNANGTLTTYNDEYEENTDIGVTLTADMSDEDSTVSGNETVTIKFTTTSTGTAATMDHQVSEMV